MMLHSDKKIDFMLVCLWNRKTQLLPQHPKINSQYNIYKNHKTSFEVKSNLNYIELSDTQKSWKNIVFFMMGSLISVGARCEEERQRAVVAGERSGIPVFVPQCGDTGAYTRAQCHQVSSPLCTPAIFPLCTSAIFPLCTPATFILCTLTIFPQCTLTTFALCTLVTFPYCT